MAKILTETDYKNPYPQPEDVPFHRWIQTHPYYNGIIESSDRDMKEIVHILSNSTSLSKKDPDFLTHHRRLALTIRYISETYQSHQYIFENFGINPRTAHTFLMEADEPLCRTQYEELMGRMAILREKRIQETRRTKEGVTTETLVLARTF